MPYDLDDIAEILKEMESKGLIHREWKSGKGTYEITAAS
jgi:DNA-binding PadR family transcriptional regulator